MNVPFVSVVVPTFNRKDMLKDCLESLFVQSYPTERYEIIVVNGGSTDGTEILLKEYEKKALCRFRWYTQNNLGCHAARDFGIKNAIGEILCFIDDDCIADRNWIRNLVEAFYNSDKIGGVGGKIIAYKIETLAEKFTEKTGILRQEKFKSLASIITGNAAYRRNVIVAIGGFNGSFRTCEDIDVSIRARLKGYALEYCPEAIVFHRHRSTIRELIKQQYGYGVGFAQLHKKYTKDFSPSYNVVLLSLRIFFTLAKYPITILKAFSQEDKKYYLSAPFISIVVMMSNLVGIIKETVFGEKYVGNKINKKLDFIEEQSISALGRKILLKLGINQIPRQDEMRFLL